MNIGFAICLLFVAIVVMGACSVSVLAEKEYEAELEAMAKCNSSRHARTEEVLVFW